MIAKSVKGKGFRGALDYDLGKEAGRILDTNMAGDTPRELSAEFGSIRKLRPNLSKAVLHVSLSAAPGEKLSDAQWTDIGRKYLAGMDLTDNQYLITRHTDTEHEHIHILANRITNAGQVISDSQDYQRQEVLMRAIEREYALQQLAPSLQSQRRAPTKGEIEKQVRTGEISTRVQLQQLADAAAQGCTSYTQYQARLEAAGVQLEPLLQLSGAKLSGLMYRLDGVVMKGSDLGRAYSPTGLARRGVTYEQSRDAAAIRASQERDPAAGLGQPSPSRQPSPTPERGGPGIHAGALSASTGGADRPGRQDPDRGRPQEPGDERDLPTPTRQRDPQPEGRDDAGAGTGKERGRPPEPSREPARVEALQPGHSDRGSDRGDYSGARERILALGLPADPAQHLGPQSGGQPPQTRRDRSLEAVQRQIAALGTARFEVEIHDGSDPVRRDWSPAELEQSVAWLKRMNARGSGVHIRPAGEHGLVLVSGLKAEAIERMKQDGFTPAATVEVSPGRYEAWIKLMDVKEGGLTDEVRTAAAAGLARRYEGALQSDGGTGGQASGHAGSQPFGRLAGFTNQDPEHAREGMQPYVLARDCNGQVAAAGSAYLVTIEQALDAAAARQERARRLEAIGVATARVGGPDPLGEYRRQAQQLIVKYGGGTDLARMDWMIAVDMAKSGRFTQQDIERGIARGTPNVQSRKAVHVEDYARRTVQKAWSAPEVVQQREERQRNLQQETKRDRGLER